VVGDGSMPRRVWMSFCRRRVWRGWIRGGSRWISEYSIVQCRPLLPSMTEVYEMPFATLIKWYAILFWLAKTLVTMFQSRKI
jgi:hypothetical protein